MEISKYLFNPSPIFFFKYLYLNIPIFRLSRNSFPFLWVQDNKVWLYISIYYEIATVMFQLNWCKATKCTSYWVLHYIKKCISYWDFYLIFCFYPLFFFQVFLNIFFIYFIILDILFKIPLKHIEVRNNDRKASQQWIPLQICGRNVRRADWSQPF